MTEKRENKLADTMVALAHSKWIWPALFLVEVAETTIIPLPYEAIFIALCASARDRIWKFVLITVAGSMLAGAIMYGLGANLIDPISVRLGVEAAVAEYAAEFSEKGATFIVLGGLTPVPSYLVNMVAGASSYPLVPFLGLFGVSRFIRFAILGALVNFLGPQISQIWQQIPKLLRTVLSVLLILGVTYWFISGFLDI